MLNLGGVACTNYDPARFQGWPNGPVLWVFHGPKSMALPRIFSGSKGTATALDLYCPQYCVTSVTTAYLARESLGVFFLGGRRLGRRWRWLGEGGESGSLGGVWGVRSG